ncbi:MAG: hypothetical protein RIT32_505 [Actinomycetota bacterium]|jgi:3-dehydroquinate synthase
MNRIDFPGNNSYPVFIGTNFDSLIEPIIANRQRIAVLTAAATQPIGQRIAKLAPSQAVVIKTLPDGEAGKTIAVAEGCWNFLAENKIARGDVIIGIGGGAVTDLANFVAATWLRGVSVVLIPTTVLGMVDAAIGGKCGINTESGKNLVGVFNDPIAVICNPEFLSTMDHKDFRAGFAEIIKCGFISDPEIIEIIKKAERTVLDWRTEAFQSVLLRAIQVKAQVVGADPYEKATDTVGRAALNYGHTLGHAIEKFSGFTWRHGDAISVGMVFAAELAFKMGLIEEDLLSLHYEILELLSLPTRYNDASLSDLIPIMALDKKVAQGNVRFVLLTELGRSKYVSDIEPDTLAAAFAALGED